VLTDKYSYTFLCSNLQKEINQKLCRLGRMKNKNLNTKILKIHEFATVHELSNMMKINTADLISSCMSLGVMVTLNQRLDSDMITILSNEFGYKTEFIKIDEEDIFNNNKNDLEKDLYPRPPIVMVMGHVDHGKTTLLDYIRNTNVIAVEAGGITQHIGAYSVEFEKNKNITFLDTPGHEAFIAMRARGVKITDIVVIIIAVDDAVKNQTKEAISHAINARLPIIFAFNKVDKKNIKTDIIREQLANMNILVEEWGGKYQSQEISAKTGFGIKKLLEKIWIESELLELKANPNKLATGIVLESTLDKGLGYMTTVIVLSGTLNIGDYILAGIYHGKSKVLLDERGNRIKQGKPSQPLSLLGLNGAPSCGEKFKVFFDKKEAKQISLKRNQLRREQSIRSQKQMSLDEIGRRIALGSFQELKIIIKGDVVGSTEAMIDSLQSLSTKMIEVKIISHGIGYRV
jgi:translation initiation factor IF-2